MKRLPRYFPATPTWVAAAATATDLESGGVCSRSPALLPGREAGEFRDLLDLDLILSSLLSHQEPVAATASL